MGVYLDYNASAPLDPRVLDVMVDSYINHYGNADSRTHDFGDDVRLQVEDARGKLASLLGVRKDEVFFTSGATESNNLALLGLAEYGLAHGKTHIITSSIEHKAVLEAAKHLKTIGFDVDFVDPDESGIIQVDRVLSLLRPETLLVSIMHVNNETGVIQPVKEIGQALKAKGVLFHTDATQSCGKLVDEVRDLSYDLMSVAAHKMYGPQGIGALIMRKTRFKLPPVKKILYGGPQEHGIRPGTLPTALIVGFGKAAEIAEKEYSSNHEQAEEIKKMLIGMLEDSGIRYCVNGDLSASVSTTLNISFLGISSEALMIYTKKYCALSNGSACNSSSYNPSYVLTAMGLDYERLESAVRISWGRFSNKDEIESEFKMLLSIVKSFC